MARDRADPRAGRARQVEVALDAVEHERAAGPGTDRLAGDRDPGVTLRADAGRRSGAEAPPVVARAADEHRSPDRRGGEPDRPVVAEHEVRLDGGPGRVDGRGRAEGEAAGRPEGLRSPRAS